MQRWAFFIAFFTTIIRYYDYALFGLSAAVLAKEFMPPEQPEEQLLKFFLLFSIAVIFRPLGSIIFGTIGDLYGRGKCIKISAVLGTVATGAICFLPSYQNIGFYSSVSLLLCRILFVMSLAGEADAIKIYIREKTSIKNRYLANGLVSSCSQIGAMFAALAFYWANASQDIAVLWRVNFIIGSIGGVVTIYFRQFLTESEEFSQVQKQNITAPKAQLLDLIKANKLPFLTGLIINGTCGGIYHFLLIFWLTFNFRVLETINKTQFSINNLYLIIIYGLSALLAGYLADRSNVYKQIFLALFASLLVLIIMLIQSKQGIIIVGPQLLVMLMPFYVVPLQIMVQSMFATQSRVRLYSLGHSLGAMLFSSTTPLIGSLLWKATGNIQALFGYLILLITLLIISFLYIHNKNFMVNKY